MLHRIGFVLALSALIGCGKAEPKLVPVSGTVTHDGKPMAEGVIYFKTIETGAFETLPVKDGRYEGKAAVGERRVEINAYKTVVLKDNPMGGEIKENLVADRYNSNSTLTATVQAQGANEFNFDVKSK